MKQPKKIIFANPKGGGGKTMSCRIAAVGFAQNGYKVALHDTDLQGSLLAFLSMGGKDEPNVKAYELGSTEADVVIIDSPPRLDERPFLHAFDEADLVIVPTKPDPDDLLALAKSLPFLVERAGAKPMFVLFNCDQINRVLARSFESNLRDVGINLPLLKTSVHEYACYKQLLVRGWKGLTDAARLEAPMLANEIWTHLK